MYGYVRPPLGILKEEETERFRRMYCGLCHTLGRRYGLASRFILNYDFTYLAILLSDREEGERDSGRCPMSPIRSKPFFISHRNSILSLRVIVFRCLMIPIEGFFLIMNVKFHCIVHLSIIPLKSIFLIIACVESTFIHISYHEFRLRQSLLGRFTHPLKGFFACGQYYHRYAFIRRNMKLWFPYQRIRFEPYKPILQKIQINLYEFTVQ